MPVVGEFHGKFWRARANTPAPVGASSPWMYPPTQAGVITLSLVVCGVPLEALRPIWAQLRWYWRLAKRLWHWRAQQNQEKLETWIARLEELEPEQLVVVERVVASVQGPYWADARTKVRACATTPKFHRPEQWVEYGRALKANAGQAQNVFRHIKVVHELRAQHPEMTNPEAHLITELAYHGFAAMRR